MSSKTSFYNLSIIKSDFKRLWWIPALHTLALFMTSVYLFIEDFYSGTLARTFTDSATKFAQSAIYDYSPAFYILALTVPVILGVFLFAYLQKGKPSTFSHSIPILRKTHYISHCISGIIMFLLPLIINGTVLFLMRFDGYIAANLRVSHLLMVLGISALYSLVAFSFSIFVSMFTANVISATIFTYVFAALPYVVEAFSGYFLSTQLYGYPEGTILLLERLYFTPIQLLEFSNIALYLAISILSLLAGYLIYSVRKLENHSEVVAFRTLRPVFIFGAGIVLGCIGFSYFNSLWNVTSALALIPFGILGIIIATMIVKKSFRIFSSVYKPVLIYSAIILVLFSVLKFDLTGYERRVPSPESIKGVTFDMPHVNTFNFYTKYGERVYPETEFTSYVNDPDTIKAITALHSELITDNEVGSLYGDTITLEYKLKNGRTIKRRYVIKLSELKHLLAPIAENDVIRQLCFPVLRGADRTYTNISLQDDRYNSSDVNAIQKEAYNEIIDALKADLSQVSYEEFGGRLDTIAQLNLTFKEPSVYKNGKKVAPENLYENTEFYYIRPSYQNTIAVLEKYGVWHAYPTAEDILKIGVKGYKIYTDTVSDVVVATRSIDGENYDFIIEDPAEIKEIFQYTQNMHWIDNYGIDLVFYLKDGTSYQTAIDTDDENLPQFFKDMLNR